jgi:hypothetical protein
LVPSPLGDAAGNAGFVDGAFTEKRTEKEIVAGHTNQASQPHEEWLGAYFDMRLDAKRQFEGLGRPKSDSKLHIYLDTYY